MEEASEMQILFCFLILVVVTWLNSLFDNSSNVTLRIYVLFCRYICYVPIKTYLKFIYKEVH